MRTRSVRLAWMVVVLVAVAPVGAQNLLVNGEFTNDVSGWTSPGSDVPIFHRADVGSTLVGGSGPGCLEVQIFIYNGGSAGAYQQVAVEPGREYRLTVAYYYPGSPDNVADHVVAAVYWRDQAGDLVDWTYVRPPDLEVDTWAPLQLVAGAPPGTTHAEVRLMVGNPILQDETRPGIAYFDDAVFALAEGDVVHDALFLPAAAATPGAGGTYWSTLLWATSLVDAPVTLFATLLDPDVDNRAAMETPTMLGTVPARGTLAVDDVVTALGDSGAGGLFLLAEADAAEAQWPLFHAASRTSTANQLGDGTYGQGISAVRGSDQPVRVAPGAVVGSELRTNAGALNISDRSLTLQVRVLDGNGLEVASASWTLPPFAHHQVSLTAMGVASLDHGTVVVSCQDQQPWVAYISVIDEATGDPTYVRAE